MDIEIDIRNVLSGVIRAQQTGKYLLEESEQIAPVVRRVIEQLNTDKLKKAVKETPSQPVHNPPQYQHPMQASSIVPPTPILQPRQQQPIQYVPLPTKYMPVIPEVKEHVSPMQYSIETITLPSQ
jgi:hypothetical protein